MGMGAIIDALEEALDAAHDMRGYTPEARAAAIEAISQIRRGANADAIETLERHFLPKWADADDARRAYRETMETSNGTHNHG